MFQVGVKEKPIAGRGGAAPETESRPSPQPGKDPGETSSVTEDDNSEHGRDSEYDSDSREAPYKCQHCFATSTTTFFYKKIYFGGYFYLFLGSRDLQPAKNGQLLCNDCRTHLKKTNELPPLNKEKDTKDAKTDKDKEPAYLFRPVAESPDASPQRMRTRNKAAKEQTSSRARPKRGGTETPEPKTPSKQGSPSVTQPNTPGKKKGKNEKVETPSKSRKRGQEKTEDVEAEEKELGLFKKKRERAEVSFCGLNYLVL